MLSRAASFAGILFLPSIKLFATFLAKVAFRLVKFCLGLRTTAALFVLFLSGNGRVPLPA